MHCSDERNRKQGREEGEEEQRVSKRKEEKKRCTCRERGSEGVRR